MARSDAALARARPALVRRAARQGAFALTCAALLPMGSGRKAVRVAAIFNSEFQGMIDEADLSAEQPGAGTPPRLPLADGDSGRPQGDPRAQIGRAHVCNPVTHAHLVR